MSTLNTTQQTARLMEYDAAAFDIDCGALDNSFNSVIKAYKNML